jgi:hypothetical protein
LSCLVIAPKTSGSLVFTITNAAKPIPYAQLNLLHVGNLFIVLFLAGLLSWGEARIYAQPAVQRQVVQAVDLRLIVFDCHPTAV